MTCIVGKVSKGSVTIGGDSAAVEGYFINARNDPKVFRNGDFLFGFTSSFRMGQLLQYSFKPPARGKLDVDTYMRTKWIDALRKCLKDGGYARVIDNEDSAGTFLVGYKGRLFVVDSDFQVGESVDPYFACGCGRDVALGAMYAASSEFCDRQQVQLALEAAQAFSAGVREPFVIETIRS